MSQSMQLHLHTSFYATLLLLLLLLPPTRRHRAERRPGPQH